MKLFIIANLNRSLMRAKLLPLINSKWVNEIIWLSRRPSLELNKVTFIAASDSDRLLARSKDMFLAAFRQIRMHKPDLIMAYNIVPFGLIAYIISRLFSIPLVLNIIGGPDEIEGGGYQTENRILSRLKNPSLIIERLLVYVLKSATFVTTTGDRTKQYLIHKGLSGDRIFPISSVIDPDYFYPEQRSKIYHLCCISGLIERKRLDWLINLTADLREQKKDIRVAILGEGPLRKTLADQIKRLGLEGHVDLLGFIDDVREVLWSSRIYIMTSVLEGLPLSVMEAMACGLVPVVGDFGDVTDLVIDRKNGRIIPMSEYAMYKTALLELLEDEEMRQVYVDQALASVAGNYTIQKAIEKWDGVYQNLLRPEQIMRSGIEQ